METIIFSKKCTEKFLNCAKISKSVFQIAKIGIDFKKEKLEKPNLYKLKKIANKKNVLKFLP